MHVRNRYAESYDLDRLTRAVPELAAFRTTTPDGRPTLDFADATAVRLLNKALLLTDYGLKFWDLPPDALCPAVPGRLDYVHVVADLLGDVASRGARVTGLDVGTGASLIYPILGVREYGWRFVATDVNEGSLRAAGAIARFNPGLTKHVELRRQAKPSRLFDGVIRPGERFGFTMCNPPFYGSAKEAQAATTRKWRGLGKGSGAERNFGGYGAELYTAGGQQRFLRAMIEESYEYRERVTWFTTLVSQLAYLKDAERGFCQNPPRRREVVTLDAGHKRQRVLAWGW